MSATEKKLNNKKDRIKISHHVYKMCVYRLLNSGKNMKGRLVLRKGSDFRYKFLKLCHKFGGSSKTTEALQCLVMQFHECY